MFSVLYLIGWAATAVFVAKLWLHSPSRLSTLRAVLQGIVVGAFWPLTLWITGGFWWYRHRPPVNPYPGSSTRTRRPSAVGVVAVCVVGSLLTTAALAATAPPTPTPTGSDTTAATPNTTPPAATTTTPISLTPSSTGETVTVTRVIDGDTVELADQRTVRVLGIDTPEVRDPVECWSAEATQFARDTLIGRALRLVRDPTQDETDRYGRTVAYLELPDASNYSVLAARAGAAFAYTYDVPVQLAPQIDAAQAEAQAAGRGIWGAPCFGINGPLPTTQNPAPPPAPTPQPAPAPAPAPPPPPEPEPTREPEPGPEPARDCEPGYSPCVPSYPPDLDCGDLDNGPYAVTGSDPHRLDRDHDGQGCE